MADVQHSALTDPNIHEPKGVATATVSTVYAANGAGVGTWRKLTDADVDYSTKANNRFGWNNRVDDVYTSGSPLSIALGTKTALPNDGGNSLTDVTRPLGITYASDSFTASTLNSSYVVRVAMKVASAATATTPYTLKVTLEGGSSPLEFAGQNMFIKGGGYENDVAHSFLFYTGTLNTNQPIKIYITPDVAITVWDISYLIQRTYLEV